MVVDAARVGKLPRLLRALEAAQAVSLQPGATVADLILTSTQKGSGTVVPDPTANKNR
jgi:hypothetical protein